MKLKDIALKIIGLRYRHYIYMGLICLAAAFAIAWPCYIKFQKMRKTIGTSKWKWRYIPIMFIYAIIIIIAGIIDIFDEKVLMPFFFADGSDHLFVTQRLQNYFNKWSTQIDAGVKFGDTFDKEQKLIMKLIAKIANWVDDDKDGNGYHFPYVPEELR